MRSAWVGFAAIALLGIVGCGQQTETPHIVEEKSSQLEKTVFLVVNGESLTAETVKESVLLQERMAALSGNPIKPEHFTNWANRAAMTGIGSLAQTMLFRQECDRRNVTATSEDIEAAAETFCKYLGLDPMPVERLAEQFGDRKAIFEKAVAESAKLTAYERIYLSADISEAMVNQYFHFKTNDVLQAKEIDAKAHENADKAYQRLQAGESWETVASACSEDKLAIPGNKRFESQWTLVGADAMGIAPLVPLLPTMKPGDYTKPIEHRDGIIIVRLVEKLREHYKLARMLFRMAQPVRIPATRLEAVGIIRQQMITSSRARLLERLEKEAKFEYPMGERFTYLIWDDGSAAKAEKTAKDEKTEKTTEKAK